ncbi:Calmodulin binding protein [Trema orientale]|uniref:Calmodulin binding protein n=1 Tax=Trema orientale TaxID=63057 RepID=A0A2P5FVR5_TREOI|nr:Calmodulin binding protein [Trema orientale]
MAGKRFFNESKSDQDLPAEIRNKKPRLSLASVVGEVVMVNSLQNLFSSLEPLLRRVVNEEVEDVLRRCTRSFSRSSSLRIQALEPSSLQLVFSKSLSLPIFTGSKILDVDGNPLQIQVVDSRIGCGDQMVPVSLPHPTKVEIIVLDGDFPPRDDSWTSEQFDNKIVKERTGKRPLLHGDLTVTLRDGSAVIGDIEFTDNSSWIRSRKFRIGARVVPGTNSQGLSVREALTEAFVVKDHRGELYKKHHPPKLEDDVWRLEKIGKEGAFHKKLASEGIHTVQDFLKLSVVDTQKLRKILGVGMSERMWEVTLKHARTCEMGNKMYIFRGNQLSLMLNPICQVLKAEINGQAYSSKEIFYNNRAYIESLVKEAYAKWNSLEVVDGIVTNEIALLTQGDITMDQQYHNQGHALAIKSSFEQSGHPIIEDKSMVNVGYLPQSNEQIDCTTDWMQVNTLPYNNLYGTIDSATGIRATISESSSDGDLASRGI